MYTSDSIKQIQEQKAKVKLKLHSVTEVISNDHTVIRVWKE